MPTVHILVKGKVQGVFFRATAKEVADELEVKGWIKNADSGDVEAVVTGSKEQLEKFVSWSRKGPGRAKVTEVVTTDLDEKTFNEFSVIRGG
jgi:acylphosphatase